MEKSLNDLMDDIWTGKNSVVNALRESGEEMSSNPSFQEMENIVKKLTGGGVLNHYLIL